MNTKTLLTLALGLLPAATHAEDAAWPQWRGPLGNGVVTNSSPTTEWSEEKNVRWKVAVPGSGTSTPIIVGNKIFLLTAAGTGKKVATKFEDSTSEGEATQRQQPQPQGADPAAERPRRRGDFNEGGPLPDLAKPYDKDSDGKLNEQEQNAMREAMRSQQGGEPPLYCATTWTFLLER